MEFGLNDAQAGRINTAFMFGYFLTAPFFGYLGDRMARKWLIAAGILVWSLGTVLSGFATGFISLLGFRIMVGLGEASYATISPSLISDAYGPAKRNNALTVFYVAIPVGAALGYLIGSQISVAWGWRYAFIVAGLPGLVLAASLLPFREPVRGQAEGRQTEAAAKPRLADLLHLLRLPDYNLVVGGYVAYTFAMSIFMIHLFGDLWSPEIIGHISKWRGDLKQAVLVLPAVLLAGGGLWLYLGIRTLRQHPAASSSVQCSAPH